MQYFPVCRVGDIPEGEARLFQVAETMIGVFYVGGEYFALANACPHAGASLAHGYIQDDHVACRIHHWRFSLRDGTYLDEDLPRCNAKSYSVRIVDDQVQVGLETKPSWAETRPTSD